MTGNASKFPDRVGRTDFHSPVSRSTSAVFCQYCDSSNVSFDTVPSGALSTSVSTEVVFLSKFFFNFIANL